MNKRPSSLASSSVIALVGLAGVLLASGCRGSGTATTRHSGSSPTSSTAPAAEPMPIAASSSTGATPNPTVAPLGKPSPKPSATPPGTSVSPGLACDACIKVVDRRSYDNLPNYRSRVPVFVAVDPSAKKAVDFLNQRVRKEERSHDQIPPQLSARHQCTVEQLVGHWVSVLCFFEVRGPQVREEEVVTITGMITAGGFESVALNDLFIDAGAMKKELDRLGKKQLLSIIPKDMHQFYAPPSTMRSFGLFTTSPGHLSLYFPEDNFVQNGRGEPWGVALLEYPWATLKDLIKPRYRQLFAAK